MAVSKKRKKNGVAVKRNSNTYQMMKGIMMSKQNRDTGRELLAKQLGMTERERLNYMQSGRLPAKYTKKAAKLMQGIMANSENSELSQVATALVEGGKEAVEEFEETVESDIEVEEELTAGNGVEETSNP